MNIVLMRKLLGRDDDDISAGKEITVIICFMT
jgi:hypothetical protein